MNILKLIIKYLQTTYTTPEQRRMVIREITQALTSKTLLKVAVTSVGTDVSPLDKAPDMLGCAESVSMVIREIDPTFPIHVSTTKLFKELEKNPKYERTTDLTAGNIIISPTGYGSGGLSNGHVGIIGKNGVIYSNDSYKGTWEQNYTIKSWVARYRVRGGFPIFVFKVL